MRAGREIAFHTGKQWFLFTELLWFSQEGPNADNSWAWHAMPPRPTGIPHPKPLCQWIIVNQFFILWAPNLFKMPYPQCLHISYPFCTLLKVSYCDRACGAAPSSWSARGQPWVGRRVGAAAAVLTLDQGQEGQRGSGRQHTLFPEFRNLSSITHIKSLTDAYTPNTRWILMSFILPSSCRAFTAQ